MFGFIINQSFLVQSCLIVLPVMLLSVLGLLLVHRCCKWQEFVKHHDVAAAIFGVLGGIYGVILAFLLVLCWESFNKAKTISFDEANAVADLGRYAQAFDEPIKTRLYTECLEYLKTIIDIEWESMNRKELSPLATAHNDAIWDIILGYKTQDPQQIALYQSAIDRLDSFGDARRSRMTLLEEAIPSQMWSLLVVFGLVTTVSSYVFGVENRIFQVIMTSSLSLIITLTLVLILNLQSPFTGTIKVSLDAYRNAYQVLDRIGHEK